MQLVEDSGTTEQMGRIYYSRLERGKEIDYQKEQETAIECLRKAIDLQKAPGQEENLATSLNNLTLYKAQGHDAETEPLYSRALEILEQTLGVNHFKTQTVRENLALLHRKIKRSTS